MYFGNCEEKSDTGIIDHWYICLPVVLTPSLHSVMKTNSDFVFVRHAIGRSFPLEGPDAENNFVPMRCILMFYHCPVVILFKGYHLTTLSEQVHFIFMLKHFLM